MNTIKQTYAEVCAEIQRLQAFKAAIEHLEKTGGSTLTAGAVSNARKTTGPRAPQGTLEQAVKTALKAKGGLVNREIRAALKKAGYKYSLAPQHVGKTLTRMVAAKHLTLAHRGMRAEYSVK